MTQLNYDMVSRYWSAATPSILGPYMMDGFGFPSSAGRFRFQSERRIVDRLIDDVVAHDCALDLGSGIGFWAEYFAERFTRVVAVEASVPLFESLKERCATSANVETILGDVMEFQPDDQYDLVFLGGMLMYLNEDDIVSLFQKVIASLQAGGMVVCRESTVRQGTTTREGDYQAVYRSVADYQRIFATCGLSIRKVQINAPYVVMQMGCEIIKKWKSVLPARLQCIPIVGRLVYGLLRLGYPWITRVPESWGFEFPKLTNHFFVLYSEDQHRPASA